MVGSFDGLNIGLAGMLASQTGLNVTGQNISNANTDGYTRKIAHQKAVQIEPGRHSNNITDIYGGANVTNIERARDQYLDVQYRNQNSNYEYNKTLSEFTIAMNNILGEPSDVGLSAKINEFFNATSDLAISPDLPTAKTAFINSASALTESMREIDNSIETLYQGISQEPNGQLLRNVENLNSKLEDLASIFQQVERQRVLGSDTTSYEDQLDVLLDDISGMIDVNIIYNNAGQFEKLEMGINPVPIAPLVGPSEATVTGTNNFLSHDTPMVPAIALGVNNTLTLSVNNGNGTAVGPFDVNFEANSTIRDVVNKINDTFTAAGGEGIIASLNPNDQLVIQTKLMDGSVDNATSQVNIIGGTSLATLGLAAGAVNGTPPQSVTLVNLNGVSHKFDIVQGSNNVGSNPYKLELVTNNSLETTVGSIDKFTGTIGATFDTLNIEIPEMREQLNNFGMNIKDSFNKVLILGTTTTGAAGAELFTGDHVSDLEVNTLVQADPTLITQGKTSAISDGDIAAELAGLFSGDSAVISDGSTHEKIYLDSPSAAAITSSISVIPGDPIEIIATGVVDDNGTSVNAGTNGLGGGSLVQIQFLDAAGAVIGANIDFPAAAAAPPNDSVGFAGVVPAGAAFVQLVMNNVTFNDNNLANNQGHFGIEITQGSGSTNDSININDEISKIIGDFGTRGNLAQQKLDNSEALHNSMESNRQSISGVSLEEESANLIMYQNAFAASARIMNVMDQMLQEIMGIL